jgi:dienelactone hydrolase
MKLITSLALAVVCLAASGPLPGTQPLTAQGDLASQMVEGIDRFLLKETEATVTKRAALWAKSQDPAARRQRLAKIIGAVDKREPFEELSLLAAPGAEPGVARSELVDVFAVRWRVLKGVDAEGLLLQPAGGRKPLADVVAIADAGQTPEQVAGVSPGLAARDQFALHLAEAGCRVLVPTIIDRADTYSVSLAGQATNQPHREWVYRPAFEVGRHVIGYEVQKVLAGVDFFSRNGAAKEGRKIGVMGYGEGGLLALYAAALDERIDAACVSGYFGPRENLWREPIYRNLFGLLNELGDAELAAMVAARTLIVDACQALHVDGPPPVRQGRRGAAPGKIETPEPAAVRQEVDRALSIVKGTWSIPTSVGGVGPSGDRLLLKAIGKTETVQSQPLQSLKPPSDPQARMKRQVEQLGEFTQGLVRESEYTRRKFWEKADAARKARSAELWAEATRWYRENFENEVIGRFDRPLLDPNVRTRPVYDTPKFVGYEVVMDVFPEVFAYGILLVPKDIKEGERRPVVVCQHGLEGRPQDVADPKVDSPSYHRFACQLAERGFVTYAPQNPYIFGDRFRTLQRKANPLGKTLFSIVVPQHRQTTQWLASLPFVDDKRIAFYGLSYGGKTAMRVPPLVDRYCLSICSADFNEWVWKNTSIRSPYSYAPNIEYEIFEWDLANTFNYAEMAGLICPRPFMVERGHDDGVAPDEWVAYEFAKVKKLYSDLKIPDRARIEFFDGPHTIHGVGTFEFLHEQLNWPPPKQ